MNPNSEELPFLSNIGLVLTYKCTIACPHCIVEAGPHRKESMGLEHSLDWITQAHSYRSGKVKGLALTGGEPFYNIADLVHISGYGKTLGFIVSVVTNAFWASTEDLAIEVLAGLPAIRMISISTDVYHQKSIPFEFVKNAVFAARELGLLYNIAVCTDNEDNPEFRRIIEDLHGIGETDRIRVSTTFPVGRAQKRALDLHFDNSPKPMEGACAMASSPVIFPDGKVSACIGPVLTLPFQQPMLLGNLHCETLSDILERSELNPILHTIRIWGPHRLVSLLQQHGFAGLLPGQYIGNCICDICYKLLSDERIVQALGSIFQNEQTRNTIAYGRLYYLHESSMAEYYHLD